MDFNNLASFQRLSGMAFFKENGQASYVPFGNIIMVKLDTAPKEVSAFLYKRGKGTLARRDNYAVEPVFSLTTNQFATPNAQLLIMGDRATDASQASGSAQTFSFTAAKGQAFVLPDRGITIATVKVSTVTKVLGTDYYVDDPNIPQSLISLNGVILLPATPAGIADGDTVVATYDRPALNREVYNAFTKLNRSGTMKLFLEDETGSDAAVIWDFTCQLSVKSVGDFDPTKIREVVMEAAIFGNPVMSRRPS